MIVANGNYISRRGHIRYKIFDQISPGDFDVKNGRLVAFRNNSHNVYYDDCITGFAHYCKRFVYIDEFEVEEEYRNQGIGHCMVKDFIENLKNDPIVLFASALPKCYPEFNYESKTLDELSDEQWDIWCRYQNRLIEFYKSCGFEDITEAIGEQGYVEQRIMAIGTNDIIKIRRTLL